MEIDPNLIKREWATFKRVMPRDIYDSLVETEDMVGQQIGNRSPSGRSLGKSIEVLNIIALFCREHSEELKKLASEWKAD
jgi:hypothetical protein